MTIKTTPKTVSPKKRLRDRISTFIKDPLCHLLLIGFVVYNLSQSTGFQEPQDKIQITQDFIHQLESGFHHTYLRHPTPEEKQQLIDNAVMDLALYREGLQYNLDVADEVVKRRVIQKMNFILEGMANPGAPEISDLARYLKAHPEQFELPAQYSFEHHFINGHSTTSMEKAEALLTELQRDYGSPLTLQDDYFLRGRQFTGLNAEKINGVFGGQFARQLKNQPTGHWLGPIKSTYGTHLVRIHKVTPPRNPELSEVKDRVYAAWKQATTQTNLRLLKQTLVDKYQINIAEALSTNETPTKATAKKSTEDTQHVALN